MNSFINFHTKHKKGLKANFTNLFSCRFPQSTIDFHPRTPQHVALRGLRIEPLTLRLRGGCLHFCLVTSAVLCNYWIHFSICFFIQLKLPDTEAELVVFWCLEEETLRNWQLPFWGAFITNSHMCWWPCSWKTCCIIYNTTTHIL